MTSFIFAILPVITVVAIGRFLAWRQALPADSWRAIERLAYVLLFPALIIRALANAPFETAPWKLAAVMLVGQGMLGLIGFGARFISGSAGPAAGSIIQSNVRWNTFVALSIGSALFGDEGLALVAIAAAAMIPTANILSVWGLTSNAVHPSGERQSTLLKLTQNPLIIACIIGGAIGLSGWTLPKSIDDTLGILAQATIALGLLSAGAGFDFGALTRSGIRTLSWSLIRLLGLPLVVIGAALVFGLDGPTLAIAVICASVPTATNGYILARELGGDTSLAANLIAVQTALSALTMPLIWLVCLHFGLF